LRKVPTLQTENKRHVAGGDHFLIRFPNGYGASIIRTPYSYGGSEGFWELMVAEWNGNHGFDQGFKSPVGEDEPYGWLEDHEVVEMLRQIYARPSKPRRFVRLSVQIDYL
jgi:hypothetical protein